MSSQPKPSASYMLHRATQVATALFDKALGRYDLTHSQVLVLLSIAENPGTSQKHVSELTSIDRSTLADVANRLVRKGFIRRQRARSDARRYNLTLTRAGEEALAEARPLILNVDRNLLSSLTGEEADECIRLLSKIVEPGSGAQVVEPRNEVLRAIA
jgi:MarR family transcriptional regulator, temperature-dependent positive regulator of motility